MVCDLIRNIRTSLINLENSLCRNTCFCYHLVRTAGWKNFESKIMECSSNFKKLRLITITYAEKNCSLNRKLDLCCLLCLVVCFAKGFRHTKNFTCGTHFRSQNRVNLLEHIEREYCFLYAVMLYLTVLQIFNRWRISCEFRGHYLSSQLNHIDIADLGYQRNCSWSSRICFQYINCIAFNSVVHIHKTTNIHFNGNLSCVILDCFYHLIREILCRQDTSWVAGVYACKLNMLHNSRYKAMCAVGNSVCFTFCCVIKETIDQNRSVRCYANSCRHINTHHLVIMNNFHASAA